MLAASPCLLMWVLAWVGWAWMAAWACVLWVLVGFETLWVLRFRLGLFGMAVHIRMDEYGLFWMAWVWLLGMIWVFCSDGCCVAVRLYVGAHGVFVMNLRV